MKKLFPITIVLLFLLTLANIGFSIFLFTNQRTVYNETEDKIKILGQTDEKLGGALGQMLAQGDLDLERRNSIKVSNVSFGRDTLTINFKLGSDIFKVNNVFQDWGDHSQPPQVEAIPFKVEGRLLSLKFTPVVNPEDGKAIIVVQAQSATLGREIQVEAVFDLWKENVTQSDSRYAREPL